jgi:hypothetical protein
MDAESSTINPHRAAIRTIIFLSLNNGIALADEIYDIIIQDVLHLLTVSKRPTEVRCRCCGGKEQRFTCPASDRNGFSCIMETKPAMAWGAFIEQEFGVEYKPRISDL